MEITPVSIEFNEQVKGYLALIEWAKAKMDEYLLSMCITQDQLGKLQEHENINLR
jgi:hypothetical protein